MYLCSILMNMSMVGLVVFFFFYLFLQQSGIYIKKKFIHYHLTWMYKDLQH